MHRRCDEVGRGLAGPAAAPSGGAGWQAGRAVRGGAAGGGAVGGGGARGWKGAAIRWAPRPVPGGIRLPGGQAHSARAMNLNAVADGEARISGLSSGADVASTARCLRALGVPIEDCRVMGRGLDGLSAPAGPLDCGNSGTTMRLLAGLLAGRPFSVTLIGDESLSRRPMERVVAPLRLMGAHADTEPLRVGGDGPLHGIEYVSPVASAQVKSALLLAGLSAAGPTRIVEPSPTRDHTERMLQAIGAPVVRDGPAVILSGLAGALRPLDVRV